MVTGWPATVMVAVRAAKLFGAAESCRMPDPEVLLLVAVTQPALFTKLQ
jgi:hypothetical protein